LDKWAEVEIAKFINPATQTSFVDSNLVGNIEGLNGNLNLYVDNGQSTDVSMCVNMGGALADISWLEAGDASMISFQTVRDPFAPFGNGTVVVPTTQDDVVDVSGANIFQIKANTLGNNNSWINNTYNDPITLAARARYGQTVPYIFPAPFDTITISNAEGMFPVLIPLATTGLFNNTGAPWQWWDPNGPIASDTLLAGPPVITYHMAGLASNPNMSPTYGRTYQDTILGYVTPRLIYEMNLIGTEELDFNNSISMYPNPAKDVLSIELTNEDLELNGFQIMDNTGKTVLAGDLTEVNNNINVAALSPGVYLIQINTDKGIANSRFIKQ